MGQASESPLSTASSTSGRYSLVAVACSAGGLKALGKLLSGLPADLPVPVVIVQHLDPRHRSYLAEILDRKAALRVFQARDGQRIEPGTVYIAPPDRHFLIEPGGFVALTQTESVRFHRPSADLLFDSVAASYGPQAIAVVLTGAGTDGARGLRSIREMGGTILVQDEASSEFSGMPDAAIRTGEVDYVLPLEEIAPKLLQLLGGGRT